MNLENIIWAVIVSFGASAGFSSLIAIFALIRRIETMDKQIANLQHAIDSFTREKENDNG